MDEFVNAIVQSFQAIGMPVSAVRGSNMYTLTVAGIQYEVYGASRGSAVTLMYFRYRRTRSAGYDVQGAVRRILHDLPGRLDSKKRQDAKSKRRAEIRRLFPNGDDRLDKGGWYKLEQGLEVTATEECYQLKISCADLDRLAILCDWWQDNQ